MLFDPCKRSDRKTPVFSDVKSWDHWFCAAKCVGERHLWYDFARLRDCTRSMWVTDAVLGSPFRDVWNHHMRRDVTTLHRHTT